MNAVLMVAVKIAAKLKVSDHLSLLNDRFFKQLAKTKENKQTQEDRYLAAENCKVL